MDGIANSGLAELITNMSANPFIKRRQLGHFPFLEIRGPDSGLKGQYAQSKARPTRLVGQFVFPLRQAGSYGGSFRLSGMTSLPSAREPTLFPPPMGCYPSLLPSPIPDPSVDTPPPLRVVIYGETTKAAQVIPL